MRLLPLALFLLGGAAAAPASDEFLRSSERDLSPRERAALEEIVGDLGNPDPVVRNRALRRVSAVGRAAIPALAEALHKVNDPKFERNLCLTLGTIDDPASFALREKVLTGRESNEDARRSSRRVAGAATRRPTSPTPTGGSPPTGRSRRCARRRSSPAARASWPGSATS